jgi:hypothetical protein
MKIGEPVSLPFGALLDINKLAAGLLLAISELKKLKANHDFGEWHLLFFVK